MTFPFWGKRHILRGRAVGFNKVCFKHGSEVPVYDMGIALAHKIIHFTSDDLGLGESAENDFFFFGSWRMCSVCTYVYMWVS